MNRIYKLKFDKRRNELVVVSEITTGVSNAKATGSVEGEKSPSWRARHGAEPAVGYDDNGPSGDVSKPADRWPDCGRFRQYPDAFRQPDEYSSEQPEHGGQLEQL